MVFRMKLIIWMPKGCFNHAIVDGQQRFTTMTILYVALGEALRERELIEVGRKFIKKN